jgi:DnaJ-class molecular chaperone
MNKKSLVCPECQGARGEMVHTNVEKPNADMSYWQPCYYCAGTGMQSDEDDSYKPFWKD